MKQIKIPFLGQKIDDQYSLDFQGRLTPQEYSRRIGRLNHVIQDTKVPPYIKFMPIYTALIVVTGMVLTMTKIEEGQRQAWFAYIGLSVMYISFAVAHRYLFSLAEKKQWKAIKNLLYEFNAIDNARQVNWRCLKEKDLSHWGILFSKRYLIVEVEEELMTVFVHAPEKAYMGNASDGAKQTLFDSLPGYNDVSKSSTLFK